MNYNLFYYSQNRYLYKGRKKFQTILDYQFWKCGQFMALLLEIPKPMILVNHQVVSLTNRWFNQETARIFCTNNSIRRIIWNSYIQSFFVINPS